MTEYTDDVAVLNKIAKTARRLKLADPRADVEGFCESVKDLAHELALEKAKVKVLVHSMPDDVRRKFGAIP